MNLSKSKDRKSTTQITQSEEEEALYSKELQLQTIRVSYQNQCEVHEIPQEEQHNEVTIKTVSCQAVHNSIRKRTQIRYGSKLILLEDQYVFSDQPGTDLFKNLSADCDTSNSVTSHQPKDQEQSNRKDWKNVVKNIVKAFGVWLRKRSNHIVIPNAGIIDTLSKLQLKVKFNNKLIKTIIGTPALSGYFENFLRSGATDWLAHSKVKDCAAHAETVSKYLMACSTGRFVQLPTSQ